MFRLFKYLKPYTWLLLAAIALLFVQAMADLALPNYMSEIVNVGIQQGGIESAVPSAIRKDQMDKAMFFMSADEKEQVLANYTLIDYRFRRFQHPGRTIPGTGTATCLYLECSGRYHPIRSQPHHGQSAHGGLRHSAGGGQP